MQEIEACALHRGLTEYFAGNHSDGLFTASLDHSPTEQLIGEEWHTSALIVSAGLEHGALADDLGQIANPRTRKLTKWTRANSHYKKRFSASLMPGLDRHRVMVFAISAMESCIAASEKHFVKEFAADQYYRRHVSDGRPRVSIGPFLNARTGEQRVIELSGNQAPMVLFIAHFLRRIHQEMHMALSAVAPMWLTWNSLLISHQAVLEQLSTKPWQGCSGFLIHEAHCGGAIFSRATKSKRICLLTI